MDTRRLEIFMKVVEDNSFAQAATDLGMSQSALSQQISRLESEIGELLLDRSTRPLKVTHFGKQFYARCRNVIEALAGVDGLVSEARDGRAGLLRIGLVPSLMYGPVPAVIKSFHDARPDVDIRITHDSTATLRELLSEARLDVIFLYYSAPNTPNFTYRTLCDEPFYAAVNKDHRLAQASEITFSDLSSESIITIPREAAPENHDALVVACMQNGFSPAGVISPGSYMSHIGLVSAGLGISLIPASIAHLAVENVTYKRVTGPEVRLETLVCWHRRRESATLSAFVDHCAANITSDTIARAAPLAEN